MIRAENISVRIGDAVLLDDISFNVPAGCWLMVAGPNGAGKSTLINAMSGGISHEGDVYLMGKDQRCLTSKQQARILGVLAQNHNVNYSFSVREVVNLGRYCHSKGIFSSGSDNDDEMVEQALRLTGMWDFRDHSVLTISGGELQRVFLAQVFAQDPSILFLDEPTNHLDIGYQSVLFPMIQDWLDERKDRAVLSVVHDLGLARRFGNSALLLHKGRKIASGEKDEVFTEENLHEAYGIDVEAWMNSIYQMWLK